MEVDIEEMKCDGVVSKSRLCNMEFSNDVVEDKVSVVSIKVQVGIKKRKGVRSKAGVGGAGNVNPRSRKMVQSSLKIKTKSKMPVSLEKVTSHWGVSVSFTTKLLVIAICHLMATE